MFVKSDGALNFIRTQAPGAYTNPFGGTINDGINHPDIRFPTMMSLNIRVAHQVTGLKVFAAYRTTVGQKKHLQKLDTLIARAHMKHFLNKQNNFTTNRTDWQVSIPRVDH